ncbi:unnamed protein product [Phytomonas sp. EM1]|nr:unnamed protein product [Phytomonas sp. EM1]|eukprot:CCW63290.1 unnamed protein product [Phytomonas sp. isolate EM1]
MEGLSDEVYKRASVRRSLAFTSRTVMASKLYPITPLKWCGTPTVKASKGSSCMHRSKLPRQRRPTVYNLFVKEHFKDMALSHESPQERFKLIAFMWRQLGRRKKFFLREKEYATFQSTRLDKPTKFGILKLICPCFR